MKQFTLLAFLSGMLLISLSSCEYQALGKSGQTRISGKVENFEDIPNQVVLQLYTYDESSVAEESTMLTTELDDEGRFEIKTNKIKSPVWTGRLTIGYEVTRVTFAPGDDIFLTLDAKLFDETIRYSGKGASKNNYAAQRYLKYEDRDLGISFDDKYALPYEEYLAWRKQHMNERLALLDSMNDLKKMNQEFYEFEKEEIKWAFYNDLRIHQVRNHGDHYEEVKQLLIAEQPMTNELFYQRNKFRDKINVYVSFMAGEGASAMDHFRVSRERLAKPMRDHYDKYGLPRLSDARDSNEVIAALESEGANNQVIKDLKKVYQRINDIREKYPDSEPNITYFSSDLSVDTFKINGLIRNYDGQVKTLTMYNETLTYSGPETFSIDKDGSFSIDVPMYYSHDLYLSCGNAFTNLLASPGDEVYIEIENRDMFFFGAGAEINSRINLHIRSVRNLEQKFRVDYRTATAEEILDSQKARNEGLKEFNGQFLLDSDPPLLQTWLEKNREMDYISNLIQFPAMLENMAQRDSSRDFSLPSSYESPEVSLKPEDLISSNALYIVFSKMRASSVQTADVAKRLDSYKYKMNDLEYQLALGIEMKRTIMDMDFETADLLMDRVRSEMTTRWMVNALAQSLEYEKKVFEGLIIPEGADLNVAAETSADSLLQQIIAKHKGKVIYMDFWATWCGPCIGEFAFAEKFHEGIDEDKVVMVYMAGRSKERPWKKMIEEHSLKGDHYLLSDDQYTQLAAKFDMPGFPHYMVIDQEGMVKMKSAPRPSIGQSRLNESLIEKLNSM